MKVLMEVFLTLKYASNSLLNSIDKEGIAQEILKQEHVSFNIYNNV